jgi:hypothetical protein
MNGRVVVTRVEDSTQRFREKACERYKILSRIHLIVSSPVIRCLIDRKYNVAAVSP